jgi:hypothetical protein
MELENDTLATCIMADNKTTRLRTGKREGPVG